MELLFLVNVVGASEDNFDRHLAIKLHSKKDGYGAYVRLRKVHKGPYREERVSKHLQKVNQPTHLFVFFA